MASLHGNENDAGRQGTPPDSEESAGPEPHTSSAAAAAAATPIVVNPEPLEIFNEDAGPAPPLVMTDAATAETPIAKLRAGAPGLEIFDGVEQPVLSTEAEAAGAADSPLFEKAISKVNAPNEDAVAAPVFGYDGAAYEDDEQFGKKLQAAPTSNAAPLAFNHGAAFEDGEETGTQIGSTPPSAEEEEYEELLTIELSSQVNINGGTHEATDDTSIEDADFLPTNLERGRSTLRVPEAWPVTDDHHDANTREEEEVYIAQPLLPWWKQERTRLNAWVLLCLFSAIVLISRATGDRTEIEIYQNQIYSLTPAQMVVAPMIRTFLALSLSFSTLFSVAHFMNNALSRFLVGTTLEGIVALVLVGIWASTLSVIMDPTRGLATMYVGIEDGETADYQATISNAGLYFGSWGASICALAVLAMLVWERFAKSGGMGMWYTSKWCLLTLASVVVIIESLMFKYQVCSLIGGTEDVTCNRNMYAMVTGCVGLIVSSLMTFFSYAGRDSALSTVIAGFVMSVNYTFCTGLLCFGNGPGTYVGNQFFSAWAGFFISFSLFTGALKELLRERSDNMASLAAVVEADDEAAPQENHEHYH